MRHGLLRDEGTALFGFLAESTAFDATDWISLALAVVGLAVAGLLLRKGPRSTISFGRPDYTMPLVAMAMVAFLLAQPWFIKTPAEGSAIGAVTYWLTGIQRLGVAVLAVIVIRQLLSESNPMRLTAPQSARRLIWALAFYAVLLPFILFLGKFRSEGLVQTTARAASTADTFTLQSAIFFAVVIATPLYEEVVFRGLLMGGLRRKYGPEFSVLASAMIFALVHEQAIWPQVLCLGAILGIVYERTRSLWAPIAVHVAHNLVTFIHLQFFYHPPTS